MFIRKPGCNFKIIIIIKTVNISGNEKSNETLGLLMGNVALFGTSDANANYD